jgi:hypothetical protein
VLSHGAETQQACAARLLVPPELHHRMDNNEEFKPPQLLEAWLGVCK